MNYKSSGFLKDGSQSYEFDELPYPQKVNILQLIAFENLSNNLEKLANLPTASQLQEQIDLLTEQNDLISGQNEQYQTDIEDLTDKMTTLQKSLNTEKLKASKLREVLTMIDDLTDETID